MCNCRCDYPWYVYPGIITSVFIAGTYVIYYNTSEISNYAGSEFKIEQKPIIKINNCFYRINPDHWGCIIFILYGRIYCDEKNLCGGVFRYQ